MRSEKMHQVSIANDMVEITMFHACVEIMVSVRFFWKSFSVLIFFLLCSKPRNDDHCCIEVTDDLLRLQPVGEIQYQQLYIYICQKSLPQWCMFHRPQCIMLAKFMAAFL